MDAKQQPISVKRLVIWELAVCVPTFIAVRLLISLAGEGIELWIGAIAIAVIVIGLVAVPAVLWRRGRRTGRFVPAHLDPTPQR